MRNSNRREFSKPSQPTANKWDVRDMDPEWPFDLLETDFRLVPETTALLVIDMHGLRCDPDSELAKRYPKLVEYWHNRLDNVVVPNIQRLIAFFRQRKRKIVYTRNGNLTSTADESTRRLKLRTENPLPVGENPDHEVYPELAPRGEDLVVDKLTSGAFTASFLDHALRNMGIRGLVITGTLTDMCIFGTARAAAELGYDSLICEDACASYTVRAHEEALLMHARVFGRVAQTKDLMEELAG